MIFIIFISLIVIIYLVRYFDRKRDERNETNYERRRDSYTNLLNSLKEKEATENKTEDNSNTENIIKPKKMARFLFLAVANKDCGPKAKLQATFY